MAHFAQLDENNIVTQVIVVANEEVPDEATGAAFCKSLFGEDSIWVQTSYNNNIRKRFAGIGMTYSQEHDAFIPPKPYPSWVFNTESLNWEAPVPKPDDGKRYRWNEETVSWIEVVKPIDETNQ